jgi:hypothetical protein
VVTIEVKNIVSPNALTLLLFVVGLFGIVVAIIVNVKLAKRNLARWDHNSTIWFILSLGSFGQRQREIWRRNCGFSDEEVETAMKYQMLCLFELPIGFFVCALLEYKFLSS